MLLCNYPLLACWETIWYNLTFMQSTVQYSTVQYRGYTYINNQHSNPQSIRAERPARGESEDISNDKTGECYLEDCTLGHILPFSLVQ